MGEVVLWIPLGAAGQAWEAGLLSVGDEGSTLAPEQMGAGIQSDLVRDLARESLEVHWGVRPGKGSTADASRGILNGEGSPEKEGDLLRDPLRGMRDPLRSRAGFCQKISGNSMLGSLSTPASGSKKIPVFH